MFSLQCHGRGSGGEAAGQASCSSPAKADSTALVALHLLKCLHACGLLRKQLTHKSVLLLHLSQEVQQ